MRQLTESTDKAYLNLFSDYLYSKGIESELETDEHGKWSLWILDDDQLDEAKELFTGYESDPTRSEFKAGSQKGRERFKKDESEAKKSKAKVVDARTTFNQSDASGSVFISVGLLILSIGIFALSFMNPDVYENLQSKLWISEFKLQKSSEGFSGLLSSILSPAFWNSFLPEVRNGQVWRVITPVFMHASIMHIFFNMYWVAVFGPRVERLVGTGWFTLFFLLASILPNVGQYMVEGPNFLGMSGVVYGLIGFAWMIQRINSMVHLGMDDGLMIFATIWMLLGFVGIIPYLANIAHLGGLLVGMAFAWLFNFYMKLKQQQEITA